MISPAITSSYLLGKPSLLILADVKITRRQPAYDTPHYVPWNLGLHATRSLSSKNRSWQKSVRGTEICSKKRSPWTKFCCKKQSYIAKYGPTLVGPFFAAKNGPGTTFCSKKRSRDHFLLQKPVLATSQPANLLQQN